MIFSKDININNLENAKFLRISAKTQTDFTKTIVAVRLTKTNAISQKELFTEFTSFKQIFELKQANNFSFAIPIEQGNFHVDIWIHSNSEGVNDFIITKEY